VGGGHGRVVGAQPLGQLDQQIDREPVRAVDQPPERGVVEREQAAWAGRDHKRRCGAAVERRQLAHGLAGRQHGHRVAGHRVEPDLEAAREQQEHALAGLAGCEQHLARRQDALGAVAQKLLPGREPDALEYLELAQRVGVERTGKAVLVEGIAVVLAADHPGDHPLRGAAMVAGGGHFSSIEQVYHACRDVPAHARSELAL